MSLTVFPAIEQRTEAWYEQRRGMVTASVVGQLLTVGPPAAATIPCQKCSAPADSPCINLGRKTPTAMKGLHDVRTAEAALLPDQIKVADNDTSRALTMQLVAERLTGHVEQTYPTRDMQRGIYEEPRARDLYADHTGQEVKQVGLMRWDDPDGWSLGYSPDGLVGDDGLLEVKSPRQKGHLSTILADEVPAQHMAQMQAGMLVSGRSWCSFVSFCGGMAPYIRSVEADPEWQAAIVAAVVAFEENARRIVATYRDRTDGLPIPEHIDYFDELEIH